MIIMVLKVVFSSPEDEGIDAIFQKMVHKGFSKEEIEAVRSNWRRKKYTFVTECTIDKGDWIELFGYLEKIPDGRRDQNKDTLVHILNNEPMLAQGSWLPASLTKVKLKDKQFLTAMKELIKGGKIKLSTDNVRAFLSPPICPNGPNL